MAETCELLEKCGFFENYRGNSDVIRRGWIRMFCEDLAKSAKCERKKYRLKNGTPPPDNMAPTGKMLV